MFDFLKGALTGENLLDLWLVLFVASGIGVGVWSGFLKARRIQPGRFKWTVLRNEAVVSTRREGKNIFYSVADERLLEMLSVLYRLYCPKE